MLLWLRMTVIKIQLSVICEEIFVIAFVEATIPK